VGGMSAWAAPAVVADALLSYKVKKWKEKWLSVRNEVLWTLVF